MRKVYVVSYDICDPKRLRAVFKLMRSYGDHLQLSVFRCDLSQQELVELKAALSGIIHNNEDQVLFVDVGPEEGRSRRSFSTVGKAYLYPERHAIVV